MEDQLLGIFQLLDNPSLCQARLVCKYWKEVIDGSKRCWWLRIIDNELEVSRLSKVNPTWKKKAWRKMIKWIVRSSQNSYLALIQLGQTIQSGSPPMLPHHFHLGLAIWLHQVMIGPKKCCFRPKIGQIFSKT